MLHSILITKIWEERETKNSVKTKNGKKRKIKMQSDGNEVLLNVTHDFHVGFELRRYISWCSLSYLRDFTISFNDFAWKMNQMNFKRNSMCPSPRYRTIWVEISHQIMFIALNAHGFFLYLVKWNFNELKSSNVKYIYRKKRSEDKLSLIEMSNSMHQRKFNSEQMFTNFLVFQFDSEKIHSIVFQKKVI